MNRSRAIRRAFVLAAAATVASAAALAAASPASAHHSSVEGSYDCDKATGNWVVTWTVANSERNIAAALTLVELAPEGGSVSTIAVGAALPAGGSITGTQIVPAARTSARLTVAAEWSNGEKDKHPVSASVEFTGACDKTPKPEPTPTPTATPTATPTPAAPGAGGGELPLTGAAVGGFVAAAAALLAVGAGLFLLARRRRVRFTV